MSDMEYTITQVGPLQLNIPRTMAVDSLTVNPVDGTITVKGSDTRIAELEKKAADLVAANLNMNDERNAALSWGTDLEDRLKKAEDRLARVYDERNALVISLARLALAAGYKAGWGTDSNEQSDPEWRTVVYAQFPGVTYTDTWQGGQLVVPNFQLSWHMAPGWQTAAQALLPKFDGQWDGSFLGREPANYVGHVPSRPHLSQITSATLDCDQMSAAQVIALAAEIDKPERECKLAPYSDACPAPQAHDLWKDGDENIPRVICDANGQVVLGLCKKCGAGEAELVDPCTGKPAAQCTNADQWNCKYCDKTGSCEALQDPRNFGKAKP